MARDEDALPAVRYDTFLENSARSSSRQTNYTAALTWQPVKYLRCQLNYTYEDYAARDVSGPQCGCADAFRHIL